VTAVATSGREFEAKVVHVDEVRDLALLKIEGSGFPHLTLADTSKVRTGQTVIAIGNPSRGLPNTATKGIVSAIGQKEDLGVGVWIQTDAAINPGNSGGPLLNTAAEVVGVNTQKEFASADGRPLQGIGFALSSYDLILLLRHYYPNTAALPAERTKVVPDTDYGLVNFSSEPGGADILVDGQFVGNTPSKIRLATGPHLVEIRGAGAGVWRRELDVVKGGDVNVRAALEANIKPEQKGGAGVSQQAMISAVAVTGQDGNRVTAATAIILVTSDPVGAEIYTDGTFAGTAPVTLKLTPGDHSIRAFKKDYKNWSRVVTVETAKEIHLSVTMVKSE